MSTTHPLRLPARLGLAALALAVLFAVACSRKEKVLAPEPSPICDVTPATLDFGGQAVGRAGDTLSFTVTNRGGGTLAADIGGVCGTFLVACGCGHLRIPAGESRSVSVRFAPTRLGAASCTFPVGDSTAGCVGVTCTGTGIRPAACGLSPAALSFGDIRVDSCGAGQSVILANSGQAILQGSVPDSSKGFEVTAGAGPFSLQPGEYLTFTVRFCPKAAGLADAWLPLGTEAGCALHCTGTGVAAAPVCQLSATNLEFGGTLVGTCGDQHPLTIGNQGFGTLTGTVPARCGPFEVVSGSGPFSLGHGISKTVMIRLCPTVQGSASCVLALGTNGVCQNVGLSGAGTCNGTVTIVSKPAGARINIDNVTLSQVTPATLTLAPGTHSVNVFKTPGYSYFEGPSSFNLGCSGGDTLSYVGHHVTYISLDQTTWIDQRAPDVNHCADTIFVVGGSALPNADAVALIPQPTLLAGVRFSGAELQVHPLERCGPEGVGVLSIIPYAAASPWALCSVTGGAPGTSWSFASPARTALCGGGWVVFDVTRIVAGWYAGTLPQHGFVLAPTPDQGLTGVRRIKFSSGITTERPILKIDWVDP